MLDMADKAVGKVRGLTRADFDADENLRLALTRLVQVIGEAARQVSGECAVRYPAVPWRAQLRRRAYFALSPVSSPSSSEGISVSNS